MKIEIHPRVKMRPGPETYCYPCDEFVQLVQTSYMDDRHCPVCGRVPGALERGIREPPTVETLDALRKLYG